jgi:hypothetical protein
MKERRGGEILSSKGEELEKMGKRQAIWLQAKYGRD